MRYASEMLEDVRCLLLCILEAVEDELGLLDVLEVMQCAALYARGCGG